MKRLFYIILAMALPVALVAENPPLMGWSSWNAFGFQISEDIIKSQADAMESLGFKDCGYNHINIDDGFFGGRDENGKLLIHPERFPNGLRGLVDYIHGKGLKAGIYSDAGRNTCASYWGNPKDEIGIGVGLYGHDTEDLNLYFNELDFDFIKVDYCGADANNNADKLDLNVEQRYKEIAAAIKATGCNDVTWNICRWAFPGTWACEIADSWRTTEDIYLGWESVKSIINQSLYLSAYTSYGHYNDMDMLEVGRGGLTEEEEKTHFGMWCIMNSPLLIGCDLTKINDNSLALLQNKELIALNQNTLGLQAYVVKRENGGYVLVKDVDEKYGKSRVVAFYNPTDAEISMSVDFSLLDLSGEAQVRDLFEKSDVGTMNGSISATVPAHGTRIYKLVAENRLERTVYEAETAWLTKYQELQNHEALGIGSYIADNACSGGMKAGWVGNSADNDVQWRNVYSKNGGEYTLKVYFKTGEDRSLKLSVNGGEPVAKKVNGGSWNSVASTDIVVKLNKGENVVRIYSDDGYLPDIDKMELIKETPLYIHTTNGSIDGENYTALPQRVTPRQDLEVVLRPAPGYEPSELVVRYGVNVNGEQFVDGVQQWSEERMPASSGNVTVSGAYISDEVALFADFAPQENSEWSLVFSDEFNAPDNTQPVDEKWMRCQRYGSTWNRWLSDSEEVVYLQGGDLVTRAIPNPDQTNDPVPMITGGIKSYNRFGFTYGYVEARLLTNPWTGNFPAFWMMPEDQSAGWPDCGEIDIWEAIDAKSDTYHTIHSNWTWDLGNKNNPQSSYTSSVPYDRYHTYGLMWDETSLTWYVDGKEVGKYEKSKFQSYLDKGQWPFDKHFHLILNQSVGNGSWAKDADVTHTYETRFDWVRVYQKTGMLNTGVLDVVNDADSNGVEVVAVEGGVIVTATAPAEVAVYDLQGRKVASVTVDGRSEIALQRGVYVVAGSKVVVN